MKAMVLTGPDKPFELLDVPDPVPGPGEAVARVLACGAGLTIQHTRAGRSKTDYPRIIGHEIAGEIVEVGKGVSDLKIGDPVTAYYYLTCGECRWCRADRETLCDNLKGTVGRHVDGGYAEFIKLPSQNFIKLPDGLDYKNHPAEIGVITDAIATPVKVVKKARIKPGETLAVIGAGGGLGMQMIVVGTWAGARVIAVDVRAEKLDACREHGADAVIDASKANVAEALKELGRGGVDVIADFVASGETLQAGLKGLAKAGRLVVLGGTAAKTFAADIELIKPEREIMGSKYATKSEVREALDLVASGAVWPVVTEIRPLADAEALHQRVESGLVIGRAAIMVNL
ncbi:MAG: zinc-binding dehydrogenase [Rhodospirillales bacterium]